MAQYFEVKQKYPDAILLFRVGDFYETFGEDAIKASQILGIVLTSRNNGGSDIELAGFPYHSVDTYLPKLVKAGYRVALCEQLEKPSKEKKIVKRDVTEVVTPGVTVNDSLLASGQNNFLGSVTRRGDRFGIAFLDISTGEFIVHQGSERSVLKVLQSFSPNELLYSKAETSELNEMLSDEIYLYGMDEWFYEEDYNRQLLLKHFKVLSLKGHGIDDQPLLQIAAGTILHYLSTVQQSNLSHIQQLTKLDSDRYMWLDKFTIRNLELIRSNHESGISLREVIDKSCSPMGTRLLSKWIVLPLKNLDEIKERHDKVSFFVEHDNLRDTVREILSSLGDVERLSSKIPLKKINPKEFVYISQAIEKIELIAEKLASSGDEGLKRFVATLLDCSELNSLIKLTLVDDPPFSLNKGEVIREGHIKELDEWRHVANNGKELLASLQQEEMENTGISSLKVGFNNVFGYYLEVTNKYKDKDLIPDNWVRKQTLKNAERYITPKLKELESKILQAQEQISILEENAYQELVDKAETYVQALLRNSTIIGELDCLSSFAYLAEYSQYVKPDLDEDFVIDIKGGRHPVIETQLSEDNAYVPNDVYMDNETQQIILITGPNMSGKSAVLRQTALICLLAHMGCYVPASEARIGLVDKIFTRVGASDNISSGESTFMVEMSETSSILNNLSARSLILLDEIGRGTSTYDGISIAWSIAEFLHEHDSYRPKTLFATHYHELNQLANRFDRIKNFNVSIKEVGDNIIFLRKLVEGASESSFGIHVAQLAGMPKAIVLRASELLKKLESKALAEKENIKDTLLSNPPPSSHQLQIFDMSSESMKNIEKIMQNVDVQAMTPIECMLKLKELEDFMSKN